MTTTTHSISLAGVTRELPVIPINSSLSIAVFNLLGDTELVEAIAEQLAERLQDYADAVLVTAETKGIILAHAISRRTQQPYVVLRKTYKSYMGQALQVTSRSITTDHEQQLFLDEKDQQLIKNRPIILVDDVISTCGTVKSMRQLVELAAGEVVATACACTEGDCNDKNIIALGHLPIFSTAVSE